MFQWMTCKMYKISFLHFKWQVIQLFKKIWKCELSMNLTNHMYVLYNTNINSTLIIIQPQQAHWNCTWRLLKYITNYWPTVKGFVMKVLYVMKACQMVQLAYILQQAVCKIPYFHILTVKKYELHSTYLCFLVIV